MNFSDAANIIGWIFITLSVASIIANIYRIYRNSSSTPIASGIFAGIAYYSFAASIDSIWYIKILNCVIAFVVLVIVSFIEYSIHILARKIFKIKKNN